jgi:hypothetical protein
VTGGAVPADRWLAALHGLVPTQPADRERLVAEPAALDILGTGADVLQELVREGLPVVDGGGAGRPLFDFHDLVNVGLYSGSGASLGEMGEQVLMRFAAESPATWTGERRWAVQVEHRCPAPERPEAEWTVARPSPEVAGGHCDRWAAVEPAEPGAVHLEGVLQVHGRRLAVVAGPARDLYRQWLDDVRGDRLRFQWLPASLRLDPVRAYRDGLTDCVAASLMLERQAQELGFEARTRKGHVVGLVSVEHAWMELRDLDGVWKPVDPILAVVAHRVRAPRPEFEEFCLGSVSNRVIPWDRPAGEDLAVHHCGTSARVATAVVGMAAG